MNLTPEKLAAAHKASTESALTTLQTVFDASERLAILNLNTARTMLADSSASTRALMAAKSPDQLFALQTAAVRPTVEKALAYYRNCYEIVAQCFEDAVKPLELQCVEFNKLVCAELEKAAKASPVGSEAALVAVKSGIAAANSTYDQVTRATRQAVELAEANMAAAADATVKAVAAEPEKGSRKKSA